MRGKILAAARGAVAMALLLAGTTYGAGFRLVGAAAETLFDDAFPVENAPAPFEPVSYTGDSGAGQMQ